MAWNYYHKTVVATVGTDTFTLPTGNLKLQNAPVSRTGAFAIELFNSTYKQRVDGWNVVAEFDWRELADGVDATVRSFIEALLDEKQCTIDFDPDNEFPSETRTIDFILDGGSGAVIASFNGRARNRSSTFALISRRQFDSPTEWIIL